MNSKQKHKIVIIGGGYAGMIAALRLAGKAAGNTDITLVNAREGFVQRIRNHQLAARQDIRHYSIPKLLGRRPVRFVQGWVTGIDPEGRTVAVTTEQNQQQYIPYDKLVYALGSVAAKPNIPGVSEHTHGIGNIDEAEALRTRLAQLPAGARAVVIGGGLTGIEMATELAESRPDLRVQLVTQGMVGKHLSERGRAYLRKTFADLKIDLTEHTRVQQVEAGQIVTEKGNIPFDVSIWAGSFGVPGLARESGLAVDSMGRVQVDSLLRSVSHPDIYAVGDSSVFADRTPLRMACATALPTGAHAADNLAALVAGKPQQPFNFHYAIQCISLGRNRGLVQLVDTDDGPQERIITGLAGKLIKESICQFTVWGLKFERVMPGSMLWLGKNSPVTDANQDTRQAKQVTSS